MYNWEKLGGWWGKFSRMKNIAQCRELNGGSYAYITGMLGLDCEHEAGSEIHPVYSILIHLEDNPDADKWAFFVRNFGDEGECGREQVQLHGKKPNEPILLLIPKENLKEFKLTEYNVFAPKNCMKNMHWNYQKVDEGVLFSFQLDHPDSQSCFVGDLTFKWINPRIKAVVGTSRHFVDEELPQSFDVEHDDSLAKKLKINKALADQLALKLRTVYKPVEYTSTDTSAVIVDLTSRKKPQELFDIKVLRDMRTYQYDSLQNVILTKYMKK
jgi:hypothetical protein